MADVGNSEGWSLQRPSCKERGEKVTAKSLLQLLARQEERCAISGRRLTPDCAAIDHIVPISKGGTHTMSNVHIVHESVNRAKHTLTMEEFVALCMDVVRTAGLVPA